MTPIYIGIYCRRGTACIDKGKDAIGLKFIRPTELRSSQQFLSVIFWKFCLWKSACGSIFVLALLLTSQLIPLLPMLPHPAPNHHQQE